MDFDISHALASWDFNPHELTVRAITDANGNEKIQMRIELGILQMEMNGRPDGRQPNGVESYLDHYEQQAQEYGEDYLLGPEALEDLFREGLQYYQRYLCLYHLRYYTQVVRDTDRNLRLCAFVRKHAKRRRDQWRFDQYRPYVIMMNTRSKAMVALEAGNQDLAIEKIDEGRKKITDFFSDYGRPAHMVDCFELDFLNRWKQELVETGDSKDGGPSYGSELIHLRSELQKAITKEDYERAAVFRDQIRRIEQQAPPFVD